MTVLTLETLLELKSQLPKKQTGSYIVHIDDLLDLLRILRKGGFRFKRGIAHTGRKTSVYYIYSKGYYIATLYVDITRNIPREQVFEIQTPPEFDRDEIIWGRNYFNDTNEMWITPHLRWARFVY